MLFQNCESNLFLSTLIVTIAVTLQSGDGETNQPLTKCHWEGFATRTKKECMSRCSGYFGFWDDVSNKLICYHREGKARPIEWTMNSCKCGYVFYTKSIPSLPCIPKMEFNITTTMYRCKIICHEIKVYKYRTENTKISYCINSNKDVVSHKLQYLRNYFDPSLSRTRSYHCQCAVQSRRVINFTDSRKSQEMETKMCHMGEFRQFHKSRCTLACHTAEGFIPQNSTELVCYQREQITQVITSDDSCQCGVNQLENQADDTIHPCVPEIIHRNVDSPECEKICRNTIAFIFGRSPNRRVTHCQHKDHIPSEYFDKLEPRIGVRRRIPIGDYERIEYPCECGVGRHLPQDLNESDRSSFSNPPEMTAQSSNSRRKRYVPKGTNATASTSQISHTEGGMTHVTASEGANLITSLPHTAGHSFGLPQTGSQDQMAGLPRTFSGMTNVVDSASHTAHIEDELTHVIASTSQTANIEGAGIPHAVASTSQTANIEGAGIPHAVVSTSQTANIEGAGIPHAVASTSTANIEGAGIPHAVASSSQTANIEGAGIPHAVASTSQTANIEGAGIPHAVASTSTANIEGAGIPHAVASSSQTANIEGAGIPQDVASTSQTENIEGTNLITPLPHTAGHSVGLPQTGSQDQMASLSHTIILSGMTNVTASANPSTTWPHAASHSVRSPQTRTLDQMAISPQTVVLGGMVSHTATSPQRTYLNGTPNKIKPFPEAEYYSGRSYQAASWDRIERSSQKMICNGNGIDSRDASLPHSVTRTVSGAQLNCTLRKGINVNLNDFIEPVEDMFFPSVICHQKCAINVESIAESRMLLPDLNNPFEDFIANSGCEFIGPVKDTNIPAIVPHHDCAINKNESRKESILLPDINIPVENIEDVISPKELPNFTQSGNIPSKISTPGRKVSESRKLVFNRGNNSHLPPKKRKLQVKDTIEYC